VTDGMANTVTSVMSRGNVMHGCVMATVMHGWGVMNRGHVHSWHSVAWCRRVHGRCLHGVTSRGCLVVALRRHLALRDCVTLRGHLLRGTSAWGVVGILHLLSRSLFINYINYLSLINKICKLNHVLLEGDRLTEIKIVHSPFHPGTYQIAPSIQL
jgi:hypothetical protein